MVNSASKPIFMSPQDHHKYGFKLAQTTVPKTACEELPSQTLFSKFKDVTKRKHKHYPRVNDVPWLLISCIVTIRQTLNFTHDAIDDIATRERLDVVDTNLW
jgi:hypothetical protein